jgi:hypothetical protein
MQLDELSAGAEIDDLPARYGFYADCGAIDAWLDLVDAPAVRALRGRMQ